MERRTLEQYLQMGDGYVLTFSNRTFREFMVDAVGMDIDDETVGGLGSKANRLRAPFVLEGCEGGGEGV